MQSFKDINGKEWAISINIGTVKRVRDLLKMNLLDIGNLLETLANDPVLLCDLLFVICQEQCDAVKMSSDDFGRIFSGDILEVAQEATVEELISFFPKNKQPILRKLWSKAKDAATAVTEMIDSRVNAIDPIKLAESLLTDGRSSSASPASPELSPGN